MPKSKTNIKEPEKNRRERLCEKESSFHGRVHTITSRDRRLKTVPEPLSEKIVSFSLDARPPPKLTKLLMNVTIQGSVGAVQLVMSSNNTVNDLIIATARQYTKEGRRPFLKSTDASLFDLHYSQFSLERLEREEKLVALGSRNFFLFATKTAAKGCEKETPCCREAVENVSENVMPWIKIMHLF
ncbi:hypothetical protein like AT2G27830 [Hibiscus trionum]|uniref:DUF7054 domain-containing protein n=1 Tax=Hibiscus trionum TaxID=183268 RepID=A0A9W7IB63_HIBTR|nr:hypothetical protein like AT2G27830 [Hibiscus trionum]